MRGMAVGTMCLLCVCSGALCSGALSSRALGRDAGRPADASAEQLPADLELDRWNGRQHFMFDAQNRETTAASPDRAECKSVPTRIVRSDGSIAVIRINKCR